MSTFMLVKSAVGEMKNGILMGKIPRIETTYHQHHVR